jgi:hypothetical protein
MSFRNWHFVLIADAYSDSDVIVNWKTFNDSSLKPVQIHEGISMAQFRLTGFDFCNKTLDTHHGLGLGEFVYSLSSWNGFH